MMANVLALFVHPVSLERWQQLLLLLPLCLCVSIVYKTTKCRTIREIPVAALMSLITIVVGMYAVGGVLLLVYELAMAYSP